jgi:hypothetical protein
MEAWHLVQGKNSKLGSKEVYYFGQEFFACLNKVFQELAQKFEFMRELLITETGNTLNDETR